MVQQIVELKQLVRDNEASFEAALRMRDSQHSAQSQLADMSRTRIEQYERDISEKEAELAALRAQAHTHTHT